MHTNERIINTSGRNDVLVWYIFSLLRSVTLNTCRFSIFQDTVILSMSSPEGSTDQTWLCNMAGSKESGLSNLRQNQVHLKRKSSDPDFCHFHRVRKDLHWSRVILLLFWVHFSCFLGLGKCNNFWVPTTIRLKRARLLSGLSPKMFMRFIHWVKQLLFSSLNWILNSLTHLGTFNFLPRTDRQTDEQTDRQT